MIETQVLVFNENYRRILTKVKTVKNVKNGFIVSLWDKEDTEFFSNDFQWKFYFGIG